MNNLYSKRFYIVWALSTVGLVNIVSYLEMKMWTEYANAGGTGGVPVLTILICMAAPLLSVIVHLTYWLLRKIRGLQRPKMGIVHLIFFITSLIPMVYLVISMPGCLLAGINM